jgi:hypothetical protein
MKKKYRIIEFKQYPTSSPTYYVQQRYMFFFWGMVCNDPKHFLTHYISASWVFEGEWETTYFKTQDEAELLLDRYLEHKAEMKAFKQHKVVA